MMRYQDVYYVDGGLPKNFPNRERYEIGSPPNSGWSKAFIIGDGSLLTVLCPFTLESFQVTSQAREIENAQVHELTPERTEGLVDIITRNWEKRAHLGMQAAYDVAAVVLKKLGAKIPTAKALTADEAEVLGIKGVVIRERKERKGGKRVGGELLKQVKRSSKRGKVAEHFFHERHQSIRECMAELSMSRNSVLSALYNLNKDHGLGYEVVNDTARLIAGDGWEVFDG